MTAQRPVQFMRNGVLTQITWGEKISASQRTKSYHIARARGMKRKCAACGKSFMPYVGHQRFCSTTCQQKLPPHYRPHDLGKRNCEVCGKEFAPYVTQAIYCSARCRNRRYQLLTDPIARRAHTMSQALTGLAWKDAVLEDMLRDSLETPCPYCGRLMDMANISLDHMQPLNWRDRTSLKIRALNQRDNLHMICKDCNIRKGNIPNEKYLKLLAFLAADPELHALIMSRLGHTAGFWRLTNKAQRAKRT